MPVVEAMSTASCGPALFIEVAKWLCSSGVFGNVGAPSSVWVRLVVQLSAPSIGYVRVELGRREIGVSEHLLDAAQVGSPLEEVRRERVAEQMRVDAFRLEPGLRRQPAQDQERACAGQRAAARVQEELRPVTAV